MKKELNESYEDQVLREFEESQENEGPKIVTDLGNIKDNKPNKPKGASKLIPLYLLSTILRTTPFLWVDPF